MAENSRKALRAESWRRAANGGARAHNGLLCAPGEALVFPRIEPLLPPSAFWRAFHQYWPSFEQPPHGRYLWSLGRRRLHRRVDHLATDDAAAFAVLPETLRLYRDQDDLSRVALSWRLSEGAAEERRKEGFIEAKAPKAAVPGL
jgi:hypothetical protein